MPRSNIAVALPVVALLATSSFLLGRGVAASPALSADDYVQIQQLYADVNHALDTGQADRFASDWTSDGEFVGGRGAGRGAEPRPPIKGRAALWDMGNRAGIGTRHFVTNLLVTPTAGGASASAYLIMLDARSHPSNIVETAIYQDTLVKTADGWKFKRRVAWRDDDDISPFKPKPSSIVLK